MDLKDLQSKIFDFKKVLIPPHPLTNFQIQKYYQINLDLMEFILEIIYLKIKDGEYVINFDEYSDIRTHWIDLYAINNHVTYFDSFRVEHIPKEMEKFINRFTIKTNNYRMQAYNSVMCEYLCIGFIDLILKDKILKDFTSFFHQIMIKK